MCRDVENDVEEKDECRRGVEAADHSVFVHNPAAVQRQIIRPFLGEESRILTIAFRRRSLYLLRW